MELLEVSEVQEVKRRVLRMLELNVCLLEVL